MIFFKKYQLLNFYETIMNNYFLSNFIYSIFFFIVFICFIFCNKRMNKTNKIMVNEFKSKIKLINKYIIEISNEHQYKIINIENEELSCLENDIEIIHKKTQDIISNIDLENLQKITVYKLLIKEIEKSIKNILK